MSTMRIHLRHSGSADLRLGFQRIPNWGWNLRIGRWFLAGRHNPTPVPYRFLDLEFGRAMLEESKR